MTCVEIYEFTVVNDIWRRFYYSSQYTDNQYPIIKYHVGIENKILIASMDLDPTIENLPNPSPFTTTATPTDPSPNIDAMLHSIMQLIRIQSARIIYP